MPFKKGQSGNPYGATGGEKPFRNALRMEIAAADGDVKVLRKIAQKLLERACEGDLHAITAVADRLDGKPAQESTVAVNSKRDASDWSRDELVAFLNDRRAGSNEPN
jgi:hypothetical protein